MATDSSILAWKSHGQRSLSGYSPWGHKKSDTTEQLTHTHTHTVSPLKGAAFYRVSLVSQLGSQLKV